MLKRLFLLVTLFPTLVWAAFTPPATILLDYRDIELASNGGFKRTNEWMVRIDTQQGVDQHGQARRSLEFYCRAQNHARRIAQNQDSYFAAFAVLPTLSPHLTPENGCLCVKIDDKLWES